MQKFLENYLVDSKKGFTFAPLSAPKTGGEVLKKLRKKFFKNLVDSKKGFTFAPLSVPKISGKVSEKWFFELLVITPNFHNSESSKLVFLKFQILLE